MPPILDPAPAWAPDLSAYTILWHGCTARDKNSIEMNGIDPNVGRVDVDFGRGFYTTTLERQARQWAWDRFYDWQRKNPAVTGNQPVVLRFRVRRYGVQPRKSTLEDGLDKLLSLHFVMGDYNAEDYWSLVQHCRQSVPEDKPNGILEVVNHHKRAQTDWYEMVSGPVSAFWRQRVAMDDADQFSFHGDGVDLLNALITEGKGKGANGNGDPDYYQWMPVV
jgi:hypothetical protein